jgi:hypothetical protein
VLLLEAAANLPEAEQQAEVDDLTMVLQDVPMALLLLDEVVEVDVALQHEAEEGVVLAEVAAEVAELLGEEVQAGKVGVVVRRRLLLRILKETD